jgi:hypothetical protein
MDDFSFSFDEDSLSDGSGRNGANDSRDWGLPIDFIPEGTQQQHFESQEEDPNPNPNRRINIRLREVGSDEEDDIEDSEDEEFKDGEEEEYDHNLNPNPNHNPNPIGVQGVWDPLEAAQTLIKLYPHWVYCRGTLYVFDDSSGMWRDDKASHYKLAARFKRELSSLKKNKKTGKAEQGKSYGVEPCLLNSMLLHLTYQRRNDLWHDEKSTSTRGKILFMNGIMDMNTSVFVRKFDPELLFFCRINYSYQAPDDSMQSYIADIKERLFVYSLGLEVAIYLLEKFARALAGEHTKKIYWAVGQG